MIYEQKHEGFPFSNTLLVTHTKRNQASEKSIVQFFSLGAAWYLLPCLLFDEYQYVFLLTNVGQFKPTFKAWLLAEIINTSAQSGTVMVGDWIFGAEWLYSEFRTKWQPIPDCTSRQRLSHHWSYVGAGPLSPRFHPAPPPSASSTAAHLSPGSSGHCAAQPAAPGTTASIKTKTRDNKQTN